MLADTTASHLAFRLIFSLLLAAAWTTSTSLQYKIQSIGSLNVSLNLKVKYNPKSEENQLSCDLWSL